MGESQSGIDRPLEPGEPVFFGAKVETKFGVGHVLAIHGDWVAVHYDDPPKLVFVRMAPREESP